MDHTLYSSIIKTGAKRFLKYGLRSVSIDDICADLRISKKTFYTCFSQKEALVEAVLEDMDKKKRKPSQVLCEVEGNVIDKVMRFSLSHIKNKHNQFVTFFFDLAKYYPDIHRRSLVRKHQDMHEAIVDLLNEGVNEGLFRKDLDIPMMAEFIVTQFTMAMTLSQKEALADRLQQGLEFLIDTLLRALCNERGMTYYLEMRASHFLSDRVEPSPPLDDNTIDLYIDQLMGSDDPLYFH